MKFGSVTPYIIIENRNMVVWKYGCMKATDIKNLKELEDENARLKKLFAEVSLKNHAMKELLQKKLV